MALEHHEHRTKSSPASTRDPRSDFLPDALFDSGLGFARLGQCKNAIASFQTLAYTKTKATANQKKLAREHIDPLKANRGEICQAKASPAS